MTITAVDTPSLTTEAVHSRVAAADSPAAASVDEGPPAAPPQTPGAPQVRPYGGMPSTPAPAPSGSSGPASAGPGALAVQPLSSSALSVPSARGPVIVTPAGELADGAEPEPSFSPD